MKILELNLFCNDLKSLNDFYISNFDLALLSESENTLTVLIGKSKLTFKQNTGIESPYYHFAINIPENQINEAINWLKPKVKLIENEGSPLINFPNWNAHSVYFYDPAGNIVELIARHDLNNASNEPFSAKSLLNISEVGMPVPDVKVFHDMLNEKFGEKLWSGNLETFAAMGDQEGLFIVVTPHRNWYPTDKPCNIYPLKVKIESKNSAPAVLEQSQYKIISE